MTGSDADTERTGAGEEEDAADSGKLAKFLTPVPRPRSSIPPRPSHAPTSTEGGEIAPEPATLFSDLPVPRRNSSLLPPPGDAVTPAPAEPSLVPEISTDCHQRSEARSRECVDRIWRRSSISPATSRIRNFSSCTLDVFVAATGRPSVPKDDAYIRFTEKTAITIGC